MPFTHEKHASEKKSLAIEHVGFSDRHKTNKKEIIYEKMLINDKRRAM